MSRKTAHMIRSDLAPEEPSIELARDMEKADHDEIMSLRAEIERLRGRVDDLEDALSSAACEKDRRLFVGECYGSGGCALCKALEAKR